MFNSSSWFFLIYLLIIPEFSTGLSFLSNYNALARHPKSLWSALKMPELPWLHCSFHGWAGDLDSKSLMSTPPAQPSCQGPGPPQATSGEHSLWCQGRVLLLAFELSRKVIQGSHAQGLEPGLSISSVSSCDQKHDSQLTTPQFLH